MKLLVLITGTGRSGTSTMSGTLHHLGLHVPGPYLGANESNPKGFFESKWSVRFHKQITQAAGLNDFDSRPQAFELAQGAITPDLRAELREFLERESADHDQVVVKDPRSVWAQALWREVAEEVGLEIRYISMLRHPAEVVGSRATYYASKTDADKRRSYETFNVSRWVNNSIVSERETRGHTRSFVPYVDLLDDWRPVLARLADELGLRYDVDLASGERCAVDEFIDPGLRRHAVTWDDLQIPDRLQGLAQSIWDDLEVLCAHGGTDAAAEADLDQQGEAYAALFQESADIAHDAAESERADNKKKRERLEALEASSRAPRKAPPKRAPRSLEETPVGQVGGRDLLKVAARRARGRLKRR